MRSPESQQQDYALRQLRREGARHKPTMPRTREPLLLRVGRATGPKSEHCKETAVLGTRPVEDTTVCSEGTLFCHSTQSLRAAVLGLVLPEAYISHGPRTTPDLIRDLAKAHWIPKPSPDNRATHPDNAVAAQDLRPRRHLVHVVGVSADCRQWGLSHLFQIQQIPSSNHYEESVGDIRRKGGTSPLAPSARTLVPLHYTGPDLFLDSDLVQM